MQGQRFCFWGGGVKRNSIDDVTAFYVRRQKSDNVFFFPSEVRRSIDDVFHVRRQITESAQTFCLSPADAFVLNCCTLSLAFSVPR